MLRGKLSLIVHLAHEDRVILQQRFLELVVIPDKFNGPIAGLDL